MQAVPTTAVLGLLALGTGASTSLELLVTVRKIVDILDDCIYKGLEVFSVVPRDAYVFGVCCEVAKGLKLLAPIVQAIINYFHIMKLLDALA